VGAGSGPAEAGRAGAGDEGPGAAPSQTQPGRGKQGQRIRLHKLTQDAVIFKVPYLGL
jgi:hypothetical protein